MRSTSPLLGHVAGMVEGRLSTWAMRAPATDACTGRMDCLVASGITAPDQAS